MHFAWCTSADLQLRDLSHEKFPRTYKLIQQAVEKRSIEEKVAPGIVAGFWDYKSPNEITGISAGHRRILPSEQSLNRETEFDLASVTKIMGAATLTAVMVDRGWLTWDTRVADVLNNYLYKDTTVRHLLSHSAGYIAWQPYWEKVRNHFLPIALNEISISKRQKFMRELVLNAQREVAPGERVLYSDISNLILGFVLEDIAQMTLDRAVQKWVLHPMGLIHTHYRNVVGKLKNDDKVAATEDSSWRGGILQGYVHDENCWAMGGYAGHAGLFSRLRDVLHFARCTFGGFLSARTLNEMWTVQMGTRTLGWDTPSEIDSSVGGLFSKNTVGHLGFTGTSLWIDVDAGLAVALLTNRVHPTRENMKIKEFRPAFHVALRTDLGR